MKEETCNNCRSWEEEMYWTHFQRTHFSQVLSSGFDHQLEIPKKYSTNLGKKLPEIVTLKGPSGSMWKVGLATDDDTMFFKNGWEEFIEDHFLQEKDILTFTYDGVSQFEVLMFDGQSLCEKEAAYFVRKGGQKECGSGCQKKRKVCENSVEVPLSSPRDAVGVTTPEKSADNSSDTTPLRQPTVYEKTTYSLSEIKFMPVHLRQSIRKEKPATCFEDVEIKPEHGATSPVELPNVHRLVTQGQKDIAMRLAQGALTKEGFLVVMKPTHVYRRFYMGIPSGWVTKHLTALESQDVILRTEGRMWNTKFSYQKSKNSGAFTSGWKHFVKENNLQEYDVCVFEPGNKLHNSIVFDVKIFPAVG